MQASISILVLNVVAAGALATARGVTFAGAYPAANAAIHGVTRTSAAAVGDLVPIDVIGTALIESGAAVTAGLALACDATGRVVDFAAGVKVGRALTAATAAGQMVEVLLFPSA